MSLPDTLRAATGNHDLADALDQHADLLVVVTAARELGPCELHAVADPADPDPRPVPAAELLVTAIVVRDPATVHVCPGCVASAVADRRRDIRCRGLALEVPTDADLSAAGVTTNLAPTDPRRVARELMGRIPALDTEEW